MPNKSDSAGKLHQYYTTFYLKESSAKTKWNSPLDSKIERDIHLSYFSLTEINSLKKIGELSADCILNFAGNKIIFVEDIGVSSGAIGHNITDDIEVTTENNDKIGFSLKCSKNISQILSKNMGAKSLLEKYFGAANEQVVFYNNMDDLHLNFLNAVLNTPYKEISTAKKHINEDAKIKG